VIGKIVDEYKLFFIVKEHKEEWGQALNAVYPQDSYHLNYYYYPGSGLLQSVVGITDLTTYADI